MRFGMKACISSLPAVILDLHRATVHPRRSVLRDAALRRGTRPMLLWLWDASDPGHYRGVTDSETSARRAAESCITRGLATAARVESARFAMDWALHASYQRTGS